MNFSDLLGDVTVSHIHAPTAVTGTGTAPVATTTPTFTGFPSGVTSGSYDHTFDMTLASSYRAQFITDNGGDTAGAFLALSSAAEDGTAYLNIHTEPFPGGEIRGFLALVPETSAVPDGGPLLPLAAASILGIFAAGSRRGSGFPNTTAE